MLSFERYSGAELRWFRAGLISSTHELFGVDGAMYAKLTVEGLTSSRARLEIGPKQYMLRWSGFIRRRIKIIDLDAGTQIGELDLGISDHGEFRFDSGRRYVLKHKMLGSSWTVTDDLGSVLFSTRDRILKGKGIEVTLGPDRRSNRDVPLLIAVSRFAILMIWQEAMVAPAMT